MDIDFRIRAAIVSSFLATLAIGAIAAFSVYELAMAPGHRGIPVWMIFAGTVLLLPALGIAFIALVYAFGVLFIVSWWQWAIFLILLLVQAPWWVYVVTLAIFLIFF